MEKYQVKPGSCELNSFVNITVRVVSGVVHILSTKSRVPVKPLTRMLSSRRGLVPA